MDLTTTPGFVPGMRTTMSFRELGGLEAKDGRHVRHGLLYRGSPLINLTPDEQAIVNQIGLSFILDLRATGEAEGKDDYLPDGTEYLRIPGMYDERGVEVDFSPLGISRIASRFAEQDEQGEGAFMRSLYVSMTRDNPAVHTLVDRFVNRQAPLFFHCTAGKDRTGVCAAVLLTLLGIPDDSIVQEFLLTNEYRAEIINNPPEKLPPHMASVDNWAKANSVDEESLRAVFAAIDEGHTSRDEYFADEFGLSQADLAKLRDYYLE